ncbi:MAG TPA: hypothetical protein VK790_15305 [Solirubrobacteraceae bacterium]|jgi:hypothetical protein|nr:hypothetical protein [Solirubrobacteraceae bacterium]
MRGKPLRDGSMSNRLRVRGAIGLVVAGIWLGSAAMAPAAGACPNASFRSGASEHLPDCRAYEQVSPVEKGGQDAASLQPLEPAESSGCYGGEPCTIAYMNVGAAFDGAPGNEFDDAYLATRAVAGWQTTALSPPTAEAPANSIAKISYAFSPDLSRAVLRVPLQRLTEGAPAGVYNLFVRNAAGSYSLVTANAPPEPPPLGCGRCFEHQDLPAFAGASSDFSHVIFEASDSLVPGAPGGGVENLYETTDERVRLVGVLPDGAIPAAGATAGGGIEVAEEHAHELERAVSQDGSDVVFEAAADGGAPDAAQAGMTEVYIRVDGSTTVEASAPAAGARPGSCETTRAVCNAESAQFWTASASGSAVYFTSKASLTKASNTGVEPTSGPEPRENPGNDLYRYDVATGGLSDLTVDTNDPDGAGVLGVVGASTDGSYVYFVAEGGLGESGDGAKAGEPNLYVWHEASAGAGTVKFIARLAAPSEEEAEDLEALRTGPAFPYQSDLADWTSRPTASQAYVTPDGTHLAFMSVEPLTGYENTDRTTGEPDHEVFEYSAEDGRLVCASCDPGGARPLGSAFIGARLSERTSSPFHQPRSLSDDGSRLFFTSPDPVVPGLSGGSQKVFEYESGAAQLISGAGGGGEGVFLDASSSGDDVFFATRERLAPGDADELVDVYDARVDGGLAAPTALAPCQGSACQEPFDQPPAIPAPLSASFLGSGNLAAPRAQPTRRQLLARALSSCAKLKARARRARCIAAARKRYAPKAEGTRRGGVAGRRRSRR